MDSTIIKGKLKNLFKIKGGSKSSEKNSSSTADPSSTSLHGNSRPNAPHLQTKVSSASLHTNTSPPLASRPSVSPGSAQPSGSTPPPAITVSPSVPITEVLPSTPAPEETSSTPAPEETPYTPAPLLNLWEEALEKVNDETKRWIREHKLNSTEQAQPKSQIAELITLLESKTLSEEKDKPLQIVIGGRKITLREYVGDVVAFLTMAGDVAMTFAPPQASAPWAAAKALLKIPVKQIEQKAALVGTIQWFTRIIRRGQVYEVLYNTTTADERVVSNLHDALRDLYIAAMELLARSDVLFGSGVVKQTLNSILRPEQASGLISDLSKKEQKVVLEAQICEASRNDKAGMKFDQKISDVLTWLDGMSAPLRRIDDGIAKILEDIDANRLEKLMDFISSEDFGKSHATIMGQRTKNTGDWLIDHQGFRDWQAIPSSSTLLCLTGTVGTGKTFLTSRVIDHVKETLETSTDDQGFAFFYCNRSASSMQDPLIVLRSLVRQLTYRETGYDRIPKTVIQRCQLAKKEKRELGYTDCEELILESLNLYSRSTIILDALDESDVRSYNLAKILNGLMGKATKPVKVFISSRPGRRYLEEFETESIIKIDSNSQQGDIGKFLDEKLYSTPEFQEHQKETQELIRETFASRNGGMFQWVYLQVKQLERYTLDVGVRSWAKEIPRDLKEAYNQLWNNIKKKNSEYDVALAERAIQWVLCSFKPLKTEILLEAIQYTFEGDVLVRYEHKSEQRILSLCQDFLTIDTEKQVWILPHASVAEYFESGNLILGSCDAFASKTLLNILMEPDGTVLMPELSSEDEILRHELFYGSRTESIKEYATKLWFRHAKRYDKWLASTEGANPDAQVVASLKRFLGSPEESSDYYRKWVGSRYELRGRSNMPWVAMCYYGFYYVLRDWWENDTIKDIGLKHGSSMLRLATEGKCLTLCRHLLSVTDINNPARARSAMEEAIHRGYKIIVSLLVTQGEFDINSLYEDRETTVQYATRYPDMLQWLVDQGWVDVNRECGESTGNALIYAAENDRCQSIRILLQAGADVNAAVKLGSYGSALAATIGTGLHPLRMEAMQLLLDNGADPNLPLKVGKWGNALENIVYIHAIDNSERSERALDLLLEAGADPAMMLDLGEHGSALAAAAFLGLKDLLAAMVDITGKDRAVECLRQSRHPKERVVGYQKGFEKWKHTQQAIIEYLTDQVGVDKKTLYEIGLWQVSPEEVGRYKGEVFCYSENKGWFGWH